MKADERIEPKRPQGDFSKSDYETGHDAGEVCGKTWYAIGDIVTAGEGKIGVLEIGLNAEGNAMRERSIDSASKLCRR